MASKIIMDSFNTGQNLVKTNTILTLEIENNIPVIKANNKKIYRLITTDLTTGVSTIELTTLSPTDKPNLQILPLEFDITI